MAVCRNNKYQSRAAVERKMFTLLHSMRKKGDFILPSERVLCEKMSCSRETVRNVLDSLMSAGTIIKKGRARSISMKLLVPENLGVFSFIAHGQGMVANPAWNKLWTALTRLAEIENISTNLILVPPAPTRAEIDAAIEELSDIVVVSTLQDRFLKERIAALRGVDVISTEEDDRGLFKNMIAMDNYKAGFLCAGKLREHGYRRPALVCDKLPGSTSELYIPYERRVAGFKDGCREYGLDFYAESEFWIVGDNYKLIVRMIKTASEIINGGFDSLFLHTDVMVNYLYAALIEECRVPDELGLVTVNSFDNAISHNPVISAASHGTKQVAAEILTQIKKIITTGATDIGLKLVEPDFYDGETLR